MIQIEFSPMVDIEIKRRHAELVKEAELTRLIDEIQKSKKTQPTGKSKLLALIGRELVGLGTSLEERYGMKPEAGSRINPQ